MPTAPTALLDDLRAEMADLDTVLASVDDLDALTPAEPWTVRDTVGHLAFTDVEATLAATDPQAFLDKLPRIAADIDGFIGAQLAEGRAMGERLLPWWREVRTRLVDVLAGLDPATRLPWYGPPMSPASFATARLMEYWAHGQDIADTARVRRTPTDRLRHICHLGVRTRGFSYVIRGREAPAGDVYVELTGPSGDVWTWGEPGSADRVAGPAEDFCLLVTQRRHQEDLALAATGPLATEWLEIAQCFAGPPGPGRAPGAPPRR